MTLEEIMKIAKKEIARAEKTKCTWTPEEIKNWEERLASQAELMMGDSAWTTSKQSTKS